MVELLNTIVQQQNAFNLQVARALTELASQETRVAELEKRLAALEEKRDV
jgi:polyhydroxyalkanoate synthesis regulator phasin